MRYIDTGSRDPSQSLGQWLKDTVDSTVSEIRWQTGFFDARSLLLISSQLTRVARTGLVRAVIGSNSGATTTGALELLCSLLDLPNAKASVKIIRYASGLYHPKTFHITRGDGTQAAYVGSANLTHDGAVKHVEAGIVLDTATRPGTIPDHSGVLDAVKAAVDRWSSLTAGTNGVHDVLSAADLPTLTALGLIQKESETKETDEVVGDRKSKTWGGRSLTIMLSVPERTAAFPAAVSATPSITPKTAAATTPVGHTPAVLATPLTPPALGKILWIKQSLSATDAQRQDGNITGDLRLTQAKFRIGGRSINQTTYFRQQAFGTENWQPDPGPPYKELATIPFEIVIRGTPYGTHNLVVSHKPSGVAAQGNYTTGIRWGPLLSILNTGVNVTGMTLTIRARSSASTPYRIEIS